MKDFLIGIRKYYISVRLHDWLSEVSSTYKILIIHNKKLSMRKCIAIIISIDHRNIFWLKSLKEREVDTRSSINISLENHTDIDSAVLCIQQSIEGIFFCPGIYFNPNTLLCPFKRLYQRIFWYSTWKNKYLSTRWKSSRGRGSIWFFRSKMLSISSSTRTEKYKKNYN